jgi:hypothetical protein
MRRNHEIKVGGEGEAGDGTSMITKIRRLQYYQKDKW